MVWCDREGERGGEREEEERNERGVREGGRREEGVVWCGVIKGGGCGVVWCDGRGEGGSERGGSGLV